MTRTDHVRFALSDWRFWMGIAYFGLVMVIVGLFVLFNRTAREEAARAATAKSAGIAQVSQCFVAVRNAPVVDGFIRSHEAIIENGLLTNKASIAASPGDPLNPIRRRRSSG
jgi:Na+/melibiose symporter-like transporter